VEQAEWWDWELRFISHTEHRMEERSFSEVELRTMLADATGLTPSRREGRWLIRTRFMRMPWVVVVEPDPIDQIVYVITAFPETSAS
jgi:hypothetical protein